LNPSARVNLFWLVFCSGPHDKIVNMGAVFDVKMEKSGNEAEKAGVEAKKASAKAKAEAKK
jgi:hypothetical protein